MRFPRRLVDRLFPSLVLILVAVGLVFGSTPPASAAKNIIVMITDGAGFNAFHAASYYEYGRLGQQPYDEFPVQLGCTTFMLKYVDAEGKPLSRKRGSVLEDAVGTQPQGYNPQAAWESFDYACPDNDYTGYTDSAAAATAINTGQKTTGGRVGTTWKGERPLPNIAELAAGIGKSTGVVTTVQASHATPAAFAAHHAHRGAYHEIFNQMLASELDVIFGCGHPGFDNDNQQVQAPNDAAYKYVGGRASWEDLTDADGAKGFVFIEKKDSFEGLAAATPPLPAKVVGIARCHKTLQYNRSPRGPEEPRSDTPSGDPLNQGVPDLATMACAALQVLSQDPDGFVLQIEGGAVDWANHGNNFPRMIEEQIDFNRAVASVVHWIETNSNWEETLLIVTSDHECGRIWGPDSGPGHGDAEPRFAAVVNRGAGRIPAAEYHGKGHSNALVPLRAKGSGSEQFDDLVDGEDRRAGRLWKFSGRYCDNTDIFTVVRAAIIEAAPLAPGLE